MKTIGYMEGTDPALLTKLTLAGHDTLPLSNGWDSHGKDVSLLTPPDKVSVVVGYMHKFLRLTDLRVTELILSSVKIYKIPVVFIAPKGTHTKAKKFAAKLGIKYSLVEPATAYKTIMKILS